MSVTRPMSCKYVIYNESYNLYGETVQGHDSSALKLHNYFFSCSIEMIQTSKDSKQIGLYLKNIRKNS